MVDHFLDLYKTKTKEELEHIASSETFVPAAVKVAVYLLTENHGMQIPLPYPQLKINRYEGDESTVKHYFKTFSIREVTSAVSLALLFTGAHSVLHYIREAKGIEENYSLFQFLLIVLVFALNNSIYKKEHGRRNLLVGRLLQNTFLFGCILLISILLKWVMGPGITASTTDAFLMAFGFIVIILLAEGIISCVRRILAFFGWHIW